MQRQPVRSSNIESVGYNAKSHVLEIAFRSGGVYQYDDVPLEVYREFLSAPSKGRFLAQRIKGHYQCQKIAQR